MKDSLRSLFFHAAILSSFAVVPIKQLRLVLWKLKGSVLKVFGPKLLILEEGWHWFMGC
jgi:hypothetical protein